VAFRQTFAAVFDFRFNHLLLPRTTSPLQRQPLASDSAGSTRDAPPSFSYAPVMEVTSTSLPFTREGGWGWLGYDACLGAPGDATALSNRRAGGNDSRDVDATE
jgi:diacylglycerol diphosphate phosphatase / phosphatidate phosphatase